MHDPGGGLLIASLRNSGQRLTRAVTNTLMFEPGYPSSFITQSWAFIRRTTAWSGRRRADPTSDAGDGSMEEEDPRCIRAGYLDRSDVGAVAHRPVEEPDGPSACELDRSGTACCRTSRREPAERGLAVPEPETSARNRVRSTHSRSSPRLLQIRTRSHSDRFPIAGVTRQGEYHGAAVWRVVEGIG